MISYDFRYVLEKKYNHYVVYSSILNQIFGVFLIFSTRNWYNVEILEFWVKTAPIFKLTKQLLELPKISLAPMTGKRWKPSQCIPQNWHMYRILILWYKCNSISKTFINTCWISDKKLTFKTLYSSKIAHFHSIPHFEHMNIFTFAHTTVSKLKTFEL